MKIAVIGEFEAGSHRAHAINVVKTAGGFARLGHDVSVLCLNPRPGSPDPAELYAEPGLHWRFAPPGPGGSPPAPEAFAQWCVHEARNSAADLVYARHFAGAIGCAEASLATVLETHAHVGDSNPLLLRACRTTARIDQPLRAITTISPTLRAYYQSLGADPRRVCVVPDGVDLDLFAPPARLPHPPFARAPDSRHIVYAGHLYDYKGIPTIVAAAKRLPHFTFHLVGGTPEDVARTLASAGDLPNLHVHGAIAHSHVPPWLWHADCLLLPPSAQHPSAAWTSPVKLGEYLAAGPPVVASSISALRDWVREPAVRWFTPDDDADLARAIEESLAESPHAAAARREHARSLAQGFAYPARASAILAAAQ